MPAVARQTAGRGDDGQANAGPAWADRKPAGNRKTIGSKANNNGNNERLAGAKTEYGRDSYPDRPSKGRFWFAVMTEHPERAASVPRLELCGAHAALGRLWRSGEDPAAPASGRGGIFSARARAVHGVQARRRKLSFAHPALHAPCAALGGRGPAAGLYCADARRLQGAPFRVGQAPPHPLAPPGAPAIGAAGVRAVPDGSGRRRKRPAAHAAFGLPVARLGDCAAVRSRGRVPRGAPPCGTRPSSSGTSGSEPGTPCRTCGTARGARRRPLLPPRPCMNRSSAPARSGAAQTRGRTARTQSYPAIRSCCGGGRLQGCARAAGGGGRSGGAGDRPTAGPSRRRSCRPCSRRGAGFSGRAAAAAAAAAAAPRPPLGLAVRRPPGLGAAGRRAVAPQPALPEAGRKLCRAHEAPGLWRLAAGHAAAVVCDGSARARRPPALVGAVPHAAAGRRELSAALPALSNAAPGGLGPAARGVRALAGQIDGVLFGVGGVLAVAPAGVGQRALGAAFGRAVRPALSGPHARPELLAACVALDPFDRRGGPGDGIVSPVVAVFPARVRAVAVGGARRLERSAALLAFDRPVVAARLERTAPAAPVPHVPARIGAVADAAVARAERAAALGARHAQDPDGL